MVKMSDVADLANVSRATVSRVLSNPEMVSEITKDKVLEAIEELNYKPNYLARSLRKMKNNNILVVVPDIANPFFSQVLRGIEFFAANNKYRVLLVDTKNMLSLEEEFLGYLDNKVVDGAILLTARNKQAIEQYGKKHFVVLACEYIENSNLPMVSIDNISSARKATEHLIDLGHNKIAQITGPMDVILNQDRLKGYKQALLNSNIKIDQSLIQEGDYSVESGYNIMEKLTTLRKTPTAVFASNDEMAIGAIKALKENTIKVPEDIAVIGFDDIKWASIYEPSLTTISQPTFEIGKTAMNILIDLLKGRNKVKKQQVVSDNLVIRESCGAKFK